MSNYLGIKANNKKPFVFISYCSEDASKVAPFVQLFSERMGINVWYDDGIGIGDNWNESIAENIHNCELMIMFISNHTFVKERPYVFIEYSLAKRNKNNKPVFTIFLEDINEDIIPFANDEYYERIKLEQGVKGYGPHGMDEVERN